MFLLLVCVLLVQAALRSGAIECGSAPPKVQEKVSHGDVAAEGRWPWVVAIYYTGSPQPSGFWCTGSLISNRYVLTAQHCTMESNYTSTYSVVVSSANLTTVTDRLPVKTIHPLPGFDNFQGTNDATILEIPPVEGVPPVCLPSIFEELPGEPAFTIGYGFHYDENGTETWDGLLREDFINLQSPKDCPSLVRNGTLQICVGGSRDPDLGGDSGSPLMTYVKSENKWYQIGVDRGGCEDQDTCGQHGEVFGRLTAFCKWIEETTGGEAKCSGPE